MSIDPQIEKGVRDAVALAVLAEHFTESRGREVLGVGIRAFRAILRGVQEEYLTPQELTPLPKPEVDILPFLREMAGGKAVTGGLAMSESFNVGDEVRLIPGRVEAWRDTAKPLRIAEVLPPASPLGYAYWTVDQNGGRNFFRHDQLKAPPTYTLDELIEAQP